MGCDWVWLTLCAERVRRDVAMICSTFDVEDSPFSFFDVAVVLWGVRVDFFSAVGVCTVWAWATDSAMAEQNRPRAIRPLRINLDGTWDSPE